MIDQAPASESAADQERGREATTTGNGDTNEDGSAAQQVVSFFTALHKTEDFIRSPEIWNKVVAVPALREELLSRLRSNVCQLDEIDTAYYLELCGKSTRTEDRKRIGVVKHLTNAHIPPWKQTSYPPPPGKLGRRLIEEVVSLLTFGFSNDQIKADLDTVVKARLQRIHTKKDRGAAYLQPTDVEVVLQQYEESSAAGEVSDPFALKQKRRGPPKPKSIESQSRPATEEPQQRQPTSSQPQTQQSSEHQPTEQPHDRAPNTSQPQTQQSAEHQSAEPRGRHHTTSQPQAQHTPANEETADSDQTQTGSSQGPAAGQDDHSNTQDRPISEQRQPRDEGRPLTNDHEEDDNAIEQGRNASERRLSEDFANQSQSSHSPFHDSRSNFSTPPRTAHNSSPSHDQSDSFNFDFDNSLHCTPNNTISKPSQASVPRPISAKHSHWSGQGKASANNLFARSLLSKFKSAAPIPSTSRFQMFDMASTHSGGTRNTDTNSGTTATEKERALIAGHDQACEAFETDMKAMRGAVRNFQARLLEYRGLAEEVARTHEDGVRTRTSTRQQYEARLSELRAEQTSLAENVEQRQTDLDSERFAGLRDGAADGGAANDARTRREFADMTRLQQQDRTRSKEVQEELGRVEALLRSPDLTVSELPSASTTYDQTLDFANTLSLVLHTGKVKDAVDARRRLHGLGQETGNKRARTE